jgi:hypothetical protein
MCNICAEWEKGKLTSKEAFRNIGELINTSDDEKVIEHMISLSGKILDSEVSSGESDDDMDKAWQSETYGDED